MCLRTAAGGLSIRSASRLTSTDKNAIIDLAVEIGQRCRPFMLNTFRGLQVKDVQCDENWGFIQCNEKTRESLHKKRDFRRCLLLHRDRAIVKTVAGMALRQA